MATTPSPAFALQPALNSFCSFFDIFPLPMALRLCRQLLLAASHKGRCKLKDPSLLLLFTHQLHLLCEAACTLGCLHPQAGSIELPENDAPNLALSGQYLYPRYLLTAWDCLPRHLNARQYQQPGKLLQKLAAIQPATAWHAHLQELLQYALSPDSIEGSQPLQQLLRRQQKLLQVLEASHLVMVREVFASPAGG